MPTHSTPRWTMAAVRRFDIIYAQRRNPYMIAWWSASLYSFSGNFAMAKQVLHPQWLFGYMFIYFFAISSFLRKRDRSSPPIVRFFFLVLGSFITSTFGLAFMEFYGGGFISPFLTSMKRLWLSWMIGTFEHCTELEQALSMLEHRGIHPSRIRPVLMDAHADKSLSIVDQRFDHTAKSIEIGFASATACSVLGISLGFILEWGPIIWGLIYGFGGFLLGFGIGLIIKSKHRLSHQKHKFPGVTVLVQYLNEEEAALIHETFWRYKAITVGKIERQHANSAL